MKKLICILLSALLFSATLCACGGDGAVPDTLYRSPHRY